MKVEVVIKMDKYDLEHTIYALNKAALKLVGSYDGELILSLKQQLEDELGVINDKLEDTCRPYDDDESYDDDEDYDDNGNICTKNC